MATMQQIKSELESPWLSVANGGTEEWTGTALDLIAFGNSGYTPPSDNYTSWMEVSVNPGRQDAADISLFSNVGNPTVTISAHTALGIGDGAATQLLDLAAGIYRARIFTAGGSTLHAYSFSAPAETPGPSGWFRMSSQISFRSY